MSHTLYVIVRTWLPCMTPGKAQAHSGHAASMLYSTAHSTGYCNDEPFNTYFGNRGFGTQINLKGISDDRILLLEEQCKRFGWIHDYVVDPTYPSRVAPAIAEWLEKTNMLTLPTKHDISTGLSTIFYSEWTAFWLFADSEDPNLKIALEDYRLHP